MPKREFSWLVARLPTAHENAKIPIFAAIFEIFNRPKTLVLRPGLGDRRLTGVEAQIPLWRSLCFRQCLRNRRRLKPHRDSSRP